MSFGKIKISSADKAFSDFIRTRDKWTCQKCGAKKPFVAIQCAHVYSRRHKKIRWDTENAFALCFSCHQYFTGENAEWLKFCEGILGRERMVRLMLRKNTLTHWSERPPEKEVAKYYREKIKELLK